MQLTTTNGQTHDSHLTPPVSKACWQNKADTGRTTCNLILQHTTSNLPNTILAAYSRVSPLFRLFFATSSVSDVDESHYLIYSRHLAWGYFDHPPMVAFLAALTTLFDDSVFWVRLGPIICSTISLIILRYLALELYRDERVALWSTVLLQLMPYQHLLMVGLAAGCHPEYFLVRHPAGGVARHEIR